MTRDAQHHEQSHQGESTDDGSRARRPGPDVVDAEPVTPPQLETGEGWSADPLLVSGTDAYVDGEYLYQDYVYDDKGAYTGERPFDPPEGPPTPVPNPSRVSPSSGCLVYPTDEDRYGYNAADLLEFRARVTDGGEIAYRVTLQTMTEPAVAAVAIGIDTDGGGSTATGGDASGDGGRDDWGYGIGRWDRWTSITSSSPGEPAPNSTASPWPTTGCASTSNAISSR